MSQSRLWRNPAGFLDWLSSYNLLACFVAACVAAGTFWPYAAGYNNTYFETSPIRTSLVSTENVVASVVAITLAVPMAIDALMDGMMTRVQSKHSIATIKTRKYASHEGEHIVNVLERLLMCFGFIILPANTLGALSSTSSNVALSAFCYSRCRTLSVSGAILLSFTRSKSNIISARLSALVISTLTISTVMVGSLALQGKVGGPLQTVGAALQYISIILFYLAALRFLVNGYFKYTHNTPVITKGASKSIIKPSSTRQTTVAHMGGIFFQDSKDDSGSGNGKYQQVDQASLYFSLSYCATVMGCFVAIVATTLPGSRATFAILTPAALALPHIGFSVLELGVLVFHLRQVKFASMTRLVSLLYLVAVFRVSVSRMQLFTRSFLVVLMLALCIVLSLVMHLWFHVRFFTPSVRND